MATRQQLETALRNADAAGDTAAARKLAKALREGNYFESGGPTGRDGGGPTGQFVGNDTDTLGRPLEGGRYRPGPQQAPQQKQPQPSLQAPAQPPEQPERGFGQMVGDAVSAVGEMFTGEQRTGPDIERTPSLFESDFLADLPRAQRAKIVGLAQITPNQEELAQIIATQVPDTTIQYNRDEQGNVYPVLRRKDGRVAMIDKPGFDLLNAAQISADMAAFTPAGRATGLVKGVAGAMGTEAARQGVQAQAGGEANIEDVALAGGLDAAGRGVEKIAGAAYRGARGQIGPETQEILDAGEQFGVPVMTSDVVQPRTGVGRAGQVMAETVPMVGTGGKRASQQAAREAAVDRFVDTYQGGSYEQIVESLRTQKDRIKSAAGKTYNRLTPKLNAASEAVGGIKLDQTQAAIDEASEVLTRPGRVSSPRAVEILGEIQDMLASEGKTFQNVKSNLGAWQEYLDSIDPAVRSQLSSEDRSQISRVLSALRKDRDDFAKTVLDANEYRQLKNADAAYGNMAETMKRSRIKNVLDKGDMTPEVARNLLFSNKPSEVRKLYEGLTNEGRANARATIITDIVERLSRRASGLSPDSLATELGKRKETLDIFFRGNQRRELNGLLRLLNATRRGQKAENTFNVATGQQAIPYIVGAGAVIEPSVAAAYGTIGALGRLYESPKVRGILARMASAEPGTTNFENLVRAYREQVGRVAQTLRSQETPDVSNDQEQSQNGVTSPQQ